MTRNDEGLDLIILTFAAERFIRICQFVEWHDLTPLRRVVEKQSALAYFMMNEKSFEASMDNQRVKYLILEAWGLVRLDKRSSCEAFELKHAYILQRWASSNPLTSCNFDNVFNQLCAIG